VKAKIRIVEANNAWSPYHASKYLQRSVKGKKAKIDGKSECVYF
jgi:hypothetical protein